MDGAETGIVLSPLNKDRLNVKNWRSIRSATHSVPPRAKAIPLTLDAPRARKILSKMAQDSARVFFSEHAEKQIRKRGITRTQVLRCLRHGHIVEGPARSGRGNWDLAVEVLPAGDVPRVAVALDRDERGFRSDHHHVLRTRP